MKCSGCSDWKPNKKHNYTFGVCRRQGEVVEVDDDIPSNVPLGRRGYTEETTRKGQRTRPWHQCDVAVIVSGVTRARGHL